MYINNRVTEVTICAFVKRTADDVRLGAYGVYYEKGALNEFGQPMNEAGGIREPKSVVDFCIATLEKTLSSAKSSHKLSEIRIKTAIRPIFFLIQDFKNTGFGRYKSREGIDRLREILTRFHNVTVVLKRKYRRASGKLRQAHMLALNDFYLKEDDMYWKNGVERVYTDGSCLRNGKNNPIAGCGVFYGPNDPRNASFTISGPQTNNRAEYSAALHPLEEAANTPNSRKIICTDSELLVKSIYEYLPKWKRNGFRTVKGGPVENLDLLMRIDELMGKMEKMEPGRIEFEWVPGHSGHEGNEGANNLAIQAARKADASNNN